MRVVLDACAILAYYNNERGADKVEYHLLNDECHMASVNVLEAFYLMRRGSLSVAESALDWMMDSGDIVVDDMDKDMLHVAGEIKNELDPPLGDCICAALANRLDAQLVAADSHIDRIAERGYCAVNRFR